MYEKRNEILDNESIHETVKNTIKDHINDVVKSHIFPEGKLTKEDLEDIVEYVNSLVKENIEVSDISKLKDDEIIDKIYNQVIKEYEEKISVVPIEIAEEFEKVITLNIIDKYWTEHINTMSHLREGIHLRSYGQEDPLRAYTVEGFDLFDNMLQNIDKEVTNFLVKAQITQNLERKEVSKNKITNDNDDTKAASRTKKKEKIGRNDQCPCGSGKKYKQCCGK
jgi:preprotein translocase subunit SecA